MRNSIFQCLLFFIAIPFSLFAVTEIDKQKTALVKKMRDDFYNSTYIKEVLPEDFSHLVRILEWGKKVRESRLFMSSVFRSFIDGLKCVDYVSFKNFENFLETVPPLISNYFVLQKSQFFFAEGAVPDIDTYERLTQSFNNCMCNQLSTRYHDFQLDPHNFLKGIARDLADIVDEEMGVDQLRQNLIRFSDMCLSKLLWDFNAPEKAWESAKKVADRLKDLFEVNIIGEVEDLIDLYRTLLMRFCGVLEVYSQQLPLAFYEHIRQDLATGRVLLTELKDYNVLFETRKEYFIRHLGECEERAKRFQAVTKNKDDAVQDTHIMC